MIIKLNFVTTLLLLMQSTLTLTQKDSTLHQLHNFFSDDRYTYQRSGSGIGFFSSIIISIVAGVLCFLGIMYYCKYRREGSVTIPCLGTFGQRNVQPQQPVNAAYHARPAYAQHQITYGGNPYGSNEYHQHGQQPYNSYNPNNPQYPVL